MSSAEYSDPLRATTPTRTSEKMNGGSQSEQYHSAQTSYDTASRLAQTSAAAANFGRNGERPNTMTTSTSRSWQPRTWDASGAPRSSYYFGPPSKDSAFGTAPVGVIGRDKPREVIRIERDYAGGEMCQFHPTFPLELEGRIQPTTFSELINDLNVVIIEANDPTWACLDNSIAVLSLYASPWIFGSKYAREMRKLNVRIDLANQADLNPVGLNLRYPSQTAFLFMEMEYF